MQWVGNHINDGLWSRLTCFYVNAAREEDANDHPDHLGSSSFITDATGTAIQHLQYLPFGELFVNQRNSEYDTRYKFSAKEKDDETGYSYFGARYFADADKRSFVSNDSDLSVWLSAESADQCVSMNPLSDKYPSTSGYMYVLGNPIRLIYPNGMSAGKHSTHTDAEGNVFAVYNDGDLGIYKHYEIMPGTYGQENNQEKWACNENQKIGETLSIFSFVDDYSMAASHIEVGSFEGLHWLFASMNSIESKKSCLGNSMTRLYYALNAGNGDAYDFESKGDGDFYRGSQISKGLYLSARDFGNWFAGYVAFTTGQEKRDFLQIAGAFNLSGNSKTTWPYYMNSNWPTYGEKPISNFFQRVGFEGVLTKSSFEKKLFKMFFSDHPAYLH